MTAKTDMSREAVTHRLRQMEGLWLLGKALGKVKVVSKGSEKRNRGLEIQDAIRRILFTQWNPISLTDEDPVDEFDRYIAPLYRILVTTRDRDQIIDTLARIERDEFRITIPDLNRLGSIATALLELKATIN